MQIQVPPGSDLPWAPPLQTGEAGWLHRLLALLQHAGSHILFAYPSHPAIQPPANFFAWLLFRVVGAISGDGNVLMVADFRGLVYRSQNNGATWTQLSPPTTGGVGYWVGLAMSNTGSKVLLANYNSDSVTSTDFNLLWSSDTGSTWHTTPLGNEPTGNPSAGYWASASVSSDGTTLIATQNNYDSSTGGGVYVSRNGGSTWTAFVANAGHYFDTQYVSANGSILVAGDYYGGVATSTDGGQTFAFSASPTGAPSGTSWYGMTGSLTGSVIYSLGYDSSTLLKCDRRLPLLSAACTT